MTTSKKKPVKSVRKGKSEHQRVKEAFAHPDKRIGNKMLRDVIDEVVADAPKPTFAVGQKWRMRSGSVTIIQGIFKTGGILITSGFALTPDGKCQGFSEYDLIDLIEDVPEVKAWATFDKDGNSTGCSENMKGWGRIGVGEYGPLPEEKPHSRVTDMFAGDASLDFNKIDEEISRLKKEEKASKKPTDWNCLLLLAILILQIAAMVK